MAEVKVTGEPAQRLGVTQEEVPAGHQRARDAPQHPLRALGREVHEDVAAEDDVVGLRPPQRGVVLDQVPLLEPHEGSRGVGQHGLAPLGPEPAARHLGIGLPESPGGEASAGRLFEDCRVDVDAEDRDVPRRVERPLGAMESEYASSPEAHPADRNRKTAARALDANAIRQSDLRERTKLIPVAEEVRLADRQLRRQQPELASGLGLGH